MILFCNGKQDICEEKDCEKTCPFHDDSGGKYIKTNFEKLKSMTEDDWAAAILQLYVDLTDNGIDFGSLFCDGTQDCFEEDGEIICTDERRLECIKRWLNSPEDKEYRIPVKPEVTCPLQEGGGCNELRSEIPRGEMEPG